MAVQARLKVSGIKELRKRFGSMGDLFGHNINVALRDSASEWERRIVRKQFRGARGAENGATTYSGKLRTRTGRLRGSIRHYGIGSGLKRRRFLVSQGVDYAAIQQFGGVISGRPYLKVPLPIAYRSSGTLDPQFFSQRSGGSYIYANGKRSFIVRSKKGNLLTGFSEGGAFVPTHVLKRSVTIPGPRTGNRSRLRFFETWRELAKFRNVRSQLAVSATAAGRRLS